MTTGGDLLNSALKAHYKTYSTASGRCSPLTSGYADCSGLMSFAMNDNGLYGGCGNSTGIEIWATNHGGVYVSRDFALRNAGVMLSKWGDGATGHIKMSTGAGNSFGTPSDEGHCAGYERFDARSVSRYFTVPGVAYGGAQPTERDWFDMATKADLNAVLEERGFNKYELKALNDLLNNRGFNEYEIKAIHDILNDRGFNDVERQEIHDIVLTVLQEQGLVS